MKKELTIGTPAVPSTDAYAGSKAQEFLDKYLPDGKFFRTVQDLWYFGAIASLSITFVFPPALLGLAYCVIQARKGGEQ